MNTKTFQVAGMHCASCAAIITKKISALNQVQSVNVNYGNEKATIVFENDAVSLPTLNAEIENLGYTLIDPAQQLIAKPKNELEILKNKTYFILPVTIIIFLIMMWDILAKTSVLVPKAPFPMSIFNPFLLVISTIALFWVGKNYITGVINFIRYRAANMDTLVGIGTLVAFIYSALITLIPSLATNFRLPEHTYFDVTIVVIGFITLGKFLEARSKKKTGDAIEKLLSLQAKTALIQRNNQETEVPIQDVKHDDLVIIKPGAKIPVDGVIVEGTSYINESMITGEPMPVLKIPGEHVVAGTLNTTGSIIFKATKIGSETLLASIIKMVEEAQGSKAPIEKLADKISSIFVPTVLLIAFTTLIVWLTVGTFFLGFSQALSYGLISFVGVLVIACPCALGLATPTAIIVGVGKGAREGILIKDAATLEKMHAINTVVVDKTGTITLGKPTITDIHTIAQTSEQKLISLLVSLEQKSEHPIAHAIMNYAQQKNIAPKHVLKFENLEGKGITGTIDNKQYYAGNIQLIQDLKIEFDHSAVSTLAAQGKTPIIIATTEHILGFVLVADEIKAESKQAVDDLHKLGINVVMLTGDDEKTARYIASLVNIDDVVAHVLPHHKLEKIKELQSHGNIVAMAGDGVNDAPALAQADVGVAMGTGTDVAIESSGITLLGGDMSKLVKAIKLSKITMRGIKQNLFWAFIYNIVGIPLAAGLFFPIFGWTLSPIFAGMAMAFSSVSVVGNSLRLKTKKL